MEKYKFKIKNLDCANCALELEESLKKIKQINQVNINFITQKLMVECLEENKEEIIKEIKKIIKRQEPDVTIEEML